MRVRLLVERFDELYALFANRGSEWATFDETEAQEAESGALTEEMVVVAKGLAALCPDGVMSHPKSRETFKTFTHTLIVDDESAQRWLNFLC